MYETINSPLNYSGLTFGLRGHELSVHGQSGVAH